MTENKEDYSWEFNLFWQMIDFVFKQGSVGQRGLPGRNGESGPSGRPGNPVGWKIV